MAAVTDFEMKVLRQIERIGYVSGNKQIALTAAAGRLERKGLAYKATPYKYRVTEEGRRVLSETAPPEVPALAVSAREGQLAGGGSFRLVVGIGGMTINGQDVDNQAAADTIADVFERGAKGSH